MTPTETSIARRTDAWWHSNARTGRFGVIGNLSKSILDPSKLPCLGRGRREANRGLFCFSRCARSQTEVCLLQPMCADSNRGLFGSADVRKPKQRSVWLQPMCANPNRGLFGLTKIHFTTPAGIFASARIPPPLPPPPCGRPCIDESEQYGRMRPLPVII